MNDNKYIQQILDENQQLKQLIREGKEKFAQLSEIIDIKKFANENMLFLKLPQIVRKIQDNPKLISDISEYLERLNKIKL